MNHIKRLFKEYDEAALRMTPEWTGVVAILSVFAWAALALIVAALLLVECTVEVKETMQALQEIAQP